MTRSRGSALGTNRRGRMISSPNGLNYLVYVRPTSCRTNVRRFCSCVAAAFPSFHLRWEMGGIPYHTISFPYCHLAAFNQYEYTIPNDGTPDDNYLHANHALQGTENA